MVSKRGPAPSRPRIGLRPATSLQERPRSCLVRSPLFDPVLQISRLTQQRRQRP